MVAPGGNTGVTQMRDLGLHLTVIRKGRNEAWRCPYVIHQDVSHRLESYSIGFAKLEEGPDGEDATIGGSGTLVRSTESERSSLQVTFSPTFPLMGRLASS